jgi:hypothetical protein
VLSRLQQLGIDADDSDYPGEWYLLSSDKYADDVELYKKLSSQWPRIVNPFWQLFALVFCEWGYEDTGNDAGVWIHCLQTGSGQVMTDFACGPHRLDVW